MSNWAWKEEAKRLSAKCDDLTSHLELAVKTLENILIEHDNEPEGVQRCRCRICRACYSALRQIGEVK